METLWILIGAVILLGVFYVLVPTYIFTYQRLRRKRVLRCPESGMLVEVNLDPRLAALTSPFGKPWLRVKDCTLWPKKKNCKQECLHGVT
ncbi:MAG TPA: hypothetical protein VGB25_01480 [Candidatus Binatia bacterium]